MVTLETNFERLLELVHKDLSIEELQNLLFDLGMELEEFDGSLIKIDITTERPDMVSVHGLARALRAYLGIKNPEYKTIKSDYKVIIDRSVASVRPYTVCAIVKGIHLDDQKIKEVIWVQEKLHATFGRNRKKVAIGIYPLEKITLPIYYKADRPENIRFIPLESIAEMDGNEILNNHPTGQKYSSLLTGMKKFPYFIDAKGDILSMPPIINSSRTGRVTESTTEIFIECSGHDLNALKNTLNILVYMFQDMGGKIYEMTLEYPDHILVTPVFTKEKRKITKDFISSVTGLDLTVEQYAKLLRKMMYENIETDGDKISFEVLPIRADIWHDVDIVDDIVRAYGVNNIKPVVPKVATEGRVLFENRLKSDIIDIMVGFGFQEIFTLALTDKKDQYQNMGIPNEEHIQLGHTTEQSINMVRTWLLPEVMKSLVSNRSREFPQKLFEVGEVVMPDSTADVLSRNVMKLSAAISDNKADFTQIKQCLVYLLEVLGKDAKFSAIEHGSFIEGRVARITVDGKDVGFVGEINPRVLENFGLVNPVSAFEIDLSLIYNLG